MQDQYSDVDSNEEYAQTRVSYLKRVFGQIDLGYRTQLRWPGDPVSDRSFQIFAQNCHRFSTLQIMDFTGHYIRDQGMKKLGENSHHLPNLKQLSLRHNRIKRGMKYFCDSSSILPQLRQMDFSYNKIDSSGLISLAQNGEKYPKLQYLELSANKITDEGLIKFAENGHKLTQMKTIYLGQNQITDNGFKTMIINSEKFSKLIKMNIYSKHIEGLGYRGIDAKFQSLRQIFLDSSSITDIGVKELVSTGLFKNARIICLAYNPITDEGFNTLMSNGPYPYLQDLRMNMVEINDMAYLHLIKNRTDMPKLSQGSITNSKKGVGVINHQKYKWKQIICKKLLIKHWLI